MAPDATTTDQTRYEALKRTVLTLGPIRRGSVVRRFMPCGKPGCCCQASPPQLHGPYYQWTRKVRGKTVTVRLTREEARLLQEWIANGRQLDRLVAQMETVSLRITQRLVKQQRKSGSSPKSVAVAHRRIEAAEVLGASRVSSQGSAAAPPLTRPVRSGR